MSLREVEEADAEARAAAPGHDLRHYSPRTPAIATTTTPGDATEGDIVYVAYDDRALPLPLLDGAFSPSATDPTSNSSPATSTPTSGVSTPPPMT